MNKVRLTLTDGDRAAMVYLPDATWLNELADLCAWLPTRVDVYGELEGFYFVLRRSTYIGNGRRRAIPVRVVQRATP